MRKLRSWERRRTLAALFAGLAGLVGVATGGAAPRSITDPSACAVSIAIADGGIASSIWPNGTVGLAIPIANEAKVVARDVRVRGIQASSGTRVGNIRPLRLGNLPSGRVVPLQALMLGPRPKPSARYKLVVRGTAGGCAFRAAGVVTVARRSNEQKFVVHRGSAVVQHPQKARFPRPQRTSDHDRNAETPVLVPPGPPRQLFPPTPTPTGATPAGAPGVNIIDNRNSTSTNGGTPPDPNAARGTDNVVLATFNTGISYSLDGGGSFTDVNLFAAVSGEPSRTSFFPQSDGGLCCDQVVIYVPKPNLFVWLLQYWPVSRTTGSGSSAVTRITQPNRLRIAWATPAAIRADFADAWTYADLTANPAPGVSSGLGTANNEHLDYPDLAYSTKYLYVGVDHGWPDAPGSVYTGRRIVARLDLSEMANPTATVVHYGYSELSGSNGLNKCHFVQNAPDQLVLGSLDDGSNLRLFTWPDGAGSPSPRTIGISTINTTSYTETAPDTTDWYAVSFPGNITGATYRDGTYLIAFDAGRNAPGRPRTYEIGRASCRERV